MTKSELNQQWQMAMKTPPKSRLAAIRWARRLLKLAQEIPSDLLPILTCPPIPRRFQCDNCGKDIGRSLWGWCSVECLEASVCKFKADPQSAT